MEFEITLKSIGIIHTHYTEWDSMTSQHEESIDTYVDFYKREFGAKVLEKEVTFLNNALLGCNRVLSIGCGLAVHEARLALQNPDMEFVGLDLSEDMLTHAPERPDNLDLIQGNIEALPLKDGVFDCVYYLFSLEFADNIEKALIETRRVLRPGGNALLMIANVRSWYVQKELREEDSYIRRKYKHIEQGKITSLVSQYFTIMSTRFMLGIHKEEVFESEDPQWACLLVIDAKK